MSYVLNKSILLRVVFLELPQSCVNYTRRTALFFVQIEKVELAEVINTSEFLGKISFRINGNIVRMVSLELS